MSDKVVESLGRLNLATQGDRQIGTVYVGYVVLYEYQSNHRKVIKIPVIRLHFCVCQPSFGL